MSVVWPTSTPVTSVIASSVPGVPPIRAAIPRSLARGFGGVVCAAACVAIMRRRGIAQRAERIAELRMDWRGKTSARRPPRRASARARGGDHHLRGSMEQLDLIIGPIDGFTPAVGRLVSMMRYVRSTTLRAVDGLGAHQLDHLYDDRSNSIGALLAHIASV